MNCPKCNAVLAANSKFCTHCGTKIEPAAAAAVCVKCGAPLKPGAKFCAKCGSSQTVSASQSAAQSQPAASVPMQAASQSAAQSQPTASVPMQAAPQPAAQPQPAASAPMQAASQSAAQSQPAAQPQPAASVPMQTVPQPAAQPQPAASAPMQAASRSAAQPQPAASAPMQTAPQTVGKEPKKASGGKKKSAVLPVVIVLVFLVVFALGGYVVLRYAFDVDPVAMILGEREEQDDSQEENDVLADDSKATEDPEEVEALLDELDAKLKAAKDALEEGDRAAALDTSKEILSQGMTVQRDGEYGDDAEKLLESAYEIAVKAAMADSLNIEKQVLGSAGYKEVHFQVDPVVELADELAENGYEVDSTEITEFRDGIIQRFRDCYIKKINEITEREQWSRDEAWSYAEAAHEIKEGGVPVLFDESSLDDPLRLRYEYCLAWIQRKRCENGVADKTMTNEEAFNNMVAILPETDYNLLALQDAISYGNAAGVDTSKYQTAYNAIVQELKDAQNLSIVNSGVNSETTVDVRKFWYFNDLDGEDAYKVDSNNGTTQAVRDWIRKNVPGYLN